MLAKRLPTILPAMSFDEMIEVTQIYSASGLLKDVGAITAKIKELIAKDPGALDVDPMRIELKVAGEEEVTHGPRPMAAEVSEIRSRMRLEDEMVTINGLLNKLQAGIYAGKIEGIALGMTIVLVLFGIIMKMTAMGGK
jgi:tetrahydromethanopterin S-methyltransferase subunit A